MVRKPVSTGKMLTRSVILHGSALVAMTAAPMLHSLPEKGQNVTTIEFISSKPAGNDNLDSVHSAVEPTSEVAQMTPAKTTPTSTLTPNNTIKVNGPVAKPIQLPAPKPRNVAPPVKVAKPTPIVRPKPVPALPTSVRVNKPPTPTKIAATVVPTQKLPNQSRPVQNRLVQRPNPKPAQVPPQKIASMNGTVPVATQLDKQQNEQMAKELEQMKEQISMAEAQRIATEQQLAQAEAKRMAERENLQREKEQLERQQFAERERLQKEKEQLEQERLAEMQRLQEQEELHQQEVQESVAAALAAEKARMQAEAAEREEAQQQALQAALEAQKSEFEAEQMVMAEKLAAEKAAQQAAAAQASKIAAANAALAAQNQALAQRASENRALGLPDGTQDASFLEQVEGNAPPAYPYDDRLKGNQGKLLLHYYVTKDGLVTNLRLIQSSGHSSLDQEALNAIRRFKFRPGQEGSTKHWVNFTLNGQKQSLTGGLKR